MKVQARQHDSYTTMSLIGFIFPLVGFILGIVYLTKEKQVDRKLGEHLLVVAVLAFVFWSIAWGFLSGASYEY